MNSRVSQIRAIAGATLVLTWWAMSGVASAAPAPTFTASLDRDTIGVGESATLSLRFEGGVPADVPAVPNVPGLSIASVGQSSQFNFINGQSSSTLAYNYVVRAAQPGEYTIPAIRAVVDNKALASQPLKLKVVKSGETTPDSEAIGKNAFLKLAPAKTNVFLGEVLPLEIRLYARQGNLKQPAPQLNQEGFTVGKIRVLSRAQLGHGPHHAHDRVQATCAHQRPRRCRSPQDDVQNGYCTGVQRRGG